MSIRHSSARLSSASRRSSQDEALSSEDEACIIARSIIGCHARRDTNASRCSAMHYWAAPRIFSQPQIRRSVDRRDAPLGLAELGRVDIVNQRIALQLKPLLPMSVQLLDRRMTCCTCRSCLHIM